jgi:hypothetical protein
MKPRFLPKFPVFVQDILGSLRWQRMTAAERGCYVHLLFLQWVEGALPDDPAGLLTLGSITGSPADHTLVVEAFPVCEDGLRRNGKCAEVRSKAEWYLDEQTRKSALGVAARQQPAGQPTGNPEVNPRSTLPNSELRTPKKKKTQRPTVSSSAPGEPVPPPPAKTRKPATGPEADCRAHWDREWFRTRLGQEWVWNGRDASSVAKILNQPGVTADEVCRRMTRLLESPDSWDAKNARPSLLEDRWNQFAVVVKKNGHANAADSLLAERSRA